MNWSSGKDAAMALHIVQNSTHSQIDLLLTTISAAHQRVSMHGLRRSLLEAQATALTIPLQVIELPENPSMDTYGRIMTEQLSLLSAKGFSTTYFGDIFLEDLRSYREDMLRPFGFEVIFPLWNKDTRQLLREIIASGLKAIVVAVNAQVLDKSFCGRIIDIAFLEDLPPEVDPCGENGEFHTFCFDGPLFKYPIAIKKEAIVYRTYPAPKTDTGEPQQAYGFWFCDLYLDQ
ncbi:MAG: ATP-binding protein [Bacteroidota bacterium]